MRTRFLILCLVSLMVVSCVHSGGGGSYLEADPVFTDRTNIIDSSSGIPTRAGWIESNPIYKGQYDVYDNKTGMRTGTTIENNQTPLFKGRWDIKSSGSKSLFQGVGGKK